MLEYHSRLERHTSMQRILLTSCQRRSNICSALRKNFIFFQKPAWQIAKWVYIKTVITDKVMIPKWRGSSVGRAEDWKSSCHQFDPGPCHHFCIYANPTDWLFCFLPHKLPSKTALQSVRKAIVHTKTVLSCSVAQIFRKVPVSPPIFDTVRNLLQINACLWQYSRQFFPSRNPHQPRFEPQSSRGICLSQRRKIIS